jgi:hypothetical protein
MANIHVQLDHGSGPTTTRAIHNGRVLADSTMPMRDGCKQLLADGAEPTDFVHFSRGGRLIGNYRIEGPARWPDLSPAKPERRVFVFDHSRRSPANRAGGLQHRKDYQ